MIDRRRFIFFGAGILASGALVPRSPLQELEAFVDVGREQHFGPSIVLSFRDDLTPALLRFGREMERLGEQLRSGLTPAGGLVLPPGVVWTTIPPHPLFRCFVKSAAAAHSAAAAIDALRLPLEHVADRARELHRLYLRETTP